jgi:hypothetical protein
MMTEYRFGPWQLSAELTDDHAYPSPKLDREAAESVHAAQAGVAYTPQAREA